MIGGYNWLSLVLHIEMHKETSLDMTQIFDMSPVDALQLHEIKALLQQNLNKKAPY